MASNPFNIQMLSPRTAELLVLLKQEVQNPPELAALVGSSFNDGVAFALKTMQKMKK